MTEAQKEHARLLNTAKIYLVESNDALTSAKREGESQTEINQLQNIVRLDERVIEFLEANQPSA